MKFKPVPAIPSIQWLPAERLGQLHVDANLRPWLIAKGLLSERIKAVCGERFALRLVDQWSGLLTGSQKLGLRADDNAGLFRDVEMYRDDQVWVFAQTVTPDSSDDKLTARALREAQVRPAGLWARRSRVALRGAPLLMQEVFLPAMGRP